MLQVCATFATCATFIRGSSMHFCGVFYIYVWARGEKVAQVAKVAQ